jgi:predicted dehydrogenase
VSYRVVLAGLGAIGMGYDLGYTADRVRTHARALSGHPAFEPLIAVDPDPERRSLFETTYTAECYESLAQALAAHQPDVVVIATPTDNHAATLRVVLERSHPRAILCEKPLDYDVNIARSMVEACERQGVALYVNYMRRADPAVAAVKRMLERDEILGPLKGVVWYSKGLFHNGSHFVDLIRYWLGKPRAASLVSVGRRWEDRDPEPDFMLEFGQSAISFLAAREECFSHYTVELVARNGRLRYERGGDRVEWLGIVDDPHFAGYRVLEEQARLLPADMARCQLNVTTQLASALAGRSTTLCTGQEGLETLREIAGVVELADMQRPQTKNVD